MSNFKSRRGQAAVEDIILFGVVAGLTLVALKTLIPHLVSSDGNTGYAVDFFRNIVEQLR